MADPSYYWFSAIVDFARSGRINLANRFGFKPIQAAAFLAARYPTIDPRIRFNSAADELVILQLVRFVFNEPFDVVVPKVFFDHPPDPDFDIKPIFPIWL